VGWPLRATSHSPIQCNEMQSAQFTGEELQVKFSGEFC
jgi:hypothetical protein